MSDVEPHAVILRGECPQCHADDDYYVLTIPKLATGELYRISGVCDACGFECDLRGSPPLRPTPHDPQPPV
jgi:C4-type Zn-finger protein